MSNCPFKHVKRLKGATPIIVINKNYIIKTEEDFSPSKVRAIKRFMSMSNKHKFILNQYNKHVGQRTNREYVAPIATAYHVRNNHFDGIKPAYTH